MSNQVNHRLLIIRKSNWFAVLVQLLFLVTLIGGFYLGGASYNSLIFGPLLYFAYSFPMRFSLNRSHRLGLRFLKRGDYEKSREHFEKSYAFFSRHSWIDRYRAFILLTSSSWGYREMALINIAVTFMLSGEAAKTKEAYERAFEEFPESDLARNALRLIEIGAKTETPHPLA